MLVHPAIDPVALQLGPVAIHWYGLTYLAAFVLFVVLGRLRLKHEPFAHLREPAWTPRDVEDILFLGVLGVVAVCVGLLAGCWPSRWRWLGAALLGVGCACLHGHAALARQLPATAAAVDHVLQGRVISLPDHGARSSRFLFQVDDDAALPVEVRDEIEMLTLMGDDTKVWGKPDGRGLVILTDEPVDFHPLRKTANVVCVPSLEQAVKYVNVATQTVGVFPFHRMADLRDRLARIQ